MIASTAAKSIGSAISLTAPSTITTMTAGDGEPDEGPRPHSDLGHRGPAGGRLDGHRAATADGGRLAAIGDVRIDGDVGGLSHGNRLQAQRVGGSGGRHEWSVLWNALPMLTS